MENNEDFIKKDISKQSKKNDVLIIFTLQETKNSNLFDKNALKRTSNSIFNMKKVNLDES